MIEEVKEIAREAGEVALRYFRGPLLEVESKGHLDLVTRADREIERLIVHHLQRQFPYDGIIGEEGASAPSRSGRTWVIDPIDGTFNYVRGTEHWSVSIGLFDGSRPVFGVLNLPAQGKLVSGGDGVEPELNGSVLPALPPFDSSRATVALGFGPSISDPRGPELVRFVGVERGLLFRACGCGSVSLLSVALGQVDGYLSLGESSWDVMAALAILDGLGIPCSVGWAEVGLTSKFPMVCANPQLLPMLGSFFR